MQHGAYILARYSTDRQNPDSIEIQVNKCSDWCSEHGIPILGVFADMAVSGMKDTRPQYQQMMRQLKTGGADTVVIYDQSRMFRKMTAWFAFRAELEKLGVTVVSVTQPQIGGDLRDPTNFLTEGSMALFNQIWALQTRQKVIEKMRVMASNGQHTGGKPPLGYTVIDGKLVIDEKEAKLVRTIFADYAAGKTYREIIAALNAAGHTTKQGNRFGSNSLHDLLRNEKYIGVLTYGRVQKRPDGSRNSHGGHRADAIRLENAIPAIVDKETWEAVQIKMEKNKKELAGRPTSAREYPLKGKVYCAECKHAMVMSKSSGRYYYYTCSGKQRRHDCDLSPIRADELENKVAAAVRNVLGDPKNMGRLIQILRNEREALQTGAAGRLQNLVTRRTELVRQLDAATDAVLQGLTSETLVSKIKSLEAEKAEVEQAVQSLKNEVSASCIPEEHLQHILDTVVSCASKDLAVLLSIVCRVEVGPEYITIWTMLDTDDHGDLLDADKALTVILGAGPPAPNPINPNQFFPVGDRFGLFVGST